MKNDNALQSSPTLSHNEHNSSKENKNLKGLHIALLKV